MRKVIDHIVENDLATQLEITVLDEPGQGGANHEYRVTGTVHDSDELPNAVVVDTAISFQNGPIKEFGVNGLTQEVLLAIVIDRLRSFQAGPFACRDNAVALTHCEEALMWLQRRTRDRIKRGVEGQTKQ
jgi:hypothetical protein